MGLCAINSFNKEDDDVSFTNLMYFQRQKDVSPTPRTIEFQLLAGGLQSIF